MTTYETLTRLIFVAGLLQFAVLIASALMTLAVNKSALVPSRWQSVAEIAYEFVAGMVRDNVGDAGKKYFPFVFALFMFILFCNLLGLVPYSFTPTSQIIITFAMAGVVFIGVTLIALYLFCCAVLVGALTNRMLGDARELRRGEPVEAQAASGDAS